MPSDQFYTVFSGMTIQSLESILYNNWAKLQNIYCNKTNNVSLTQLTLFVLGKISSDDVLKYVSYFSQKAAQGCSSLALCYFVLMFFSPFSIVMTSLWKERANLSAFRTFVRFALVWFVCFLFLLVSREGYGLWFWHSLGFFSYLFFKCPNTLFLLNPHHCFIIGSQHIVSVESSSLLHYRFYMRFMCCPKWFMNHRNWGRGLNSVKYTLRNT